MAPTNQVKDMVWGEPKMKRMLGECDAHNQVGQVTPARQRVQDMKRVKCLTASSG